MQEAHSRRRYASALKSQGTGVLSRDMGRQRHNIEITPGRSGSLGKIQEGRDLRPEEHKMS
ncbi:hypothetical protein LTR82_018407, partial [Friedmanniomyces endolithicus]